MDNVFGKRKCHFQQQKKKYLFKNPNSQSKFLLSFINSEQMAQTLGIPKLNNTMFLIKKYQRSKQLQSNVPNAMTKTLKLLGFQRETPALPGEVRDCFKVGEDIFL